MAQAISSDVDRARRGLTVALYLDDRQDEQKGDFETYWNGFLRLYNLFQFIPEAYPAAADEDAFRGYEALIGTSEPETLHGHVPEEGEIGDFDEEEWEETFAAAEYSPDSVTGLLEPVYEAELPAPEVPFELQRDGKIVGTAELGWPGPEVAILLPDQESYRDVFEDEGWTVYSASEVEAERLLEALIERA